MPNHPARTNDPFKKIKSGSWTKWGGGRQGLIHSQAEPVWYCQACADEQPQELPGYLLESPLGGDFVKVCAKCFNKARTIHYSYVSVVQIVRAC